MAATQKERAYALLLGRAERGATQADWDGRRSLAAIVGDLREAGHPITDSTTNGIVTYYLTPPSMFDEPVKRPPNQYEYDG